MDDNKEISVGANPAQPIENQGDRPVSDAFTKDNDQEISSASSSKEATEKQDGRSSLANLDASANAAPPSAPSGAPVDPASAESQRSKGKTALIMFALCMAVFLAAIDVTIITTALPTISERFQSTAGYTWIGSAYLLGSASATPLWGKISDVFGRKPILLVANGIFFIGSAIAGASVNISMLIAARAIQGIGGGGLVTLVNICIGDLFSLKTRGAYYGMIGGVWAIASALGPLIGGAFTQRVSWRWCFYINLPLDGLAFVIILFFLDVHTPKTPIWAGLKAIDWIGSIAVIGGTVMFLLGLQFGGETYPWDSATTLCLIIFGVVIIGLFVINEWKFAIYPIMPLRLFQEQTTLASLGTCFCHGMTFIAASYYLPLYFQAILGANPLLSGVYVLPTALSLSVASAATGIIIRKTGQYLPPIWVGMFLLTLGTGLFIDFRADSSWAKIIIYQLIAGVGTGPNFQAPLIAIQSSISPRDIATATATFGFIRQLATAMSVVIGGVIFQNEVKRRSDRLVASLGPEQAQRLGGASAGANVDTIKALPDAQRRVAREVFAESLSRMWILYTVIAFVGLLVSLLIRKNQLHAKHEETKTGLEAEKERKAEADAERERRRMSKLNGGKDLEAATKAVDNPSGEPKSSQ